MSKGKGSSIFWLAGFAFAAWCAMQATDYWIARREIHDFSYAQLAHDYPTASTRAKVMIQAAMAKGYIENREYDRIFTVMVKDERQGITMRDAGKSAIPDADKKRLADLIGIGAPT